MTLSEPKLIMQSRHHNNVCEECAAKLAAYIFVYNVQRQGVYSDFFQPPAFVNSPMWFEAMDAMEVAKMDLLHLEAEVNGFSQQT